jgi:replicative DNA helicase
MGVPTGFASLDAATGGMRHGDLILVGARPSVGKSSYLETVAENAAASGHFVVYVSIEQDQEQVMYRFASRAGKLSSSALIEGPKHDSDWAALWDLAEARSKTSLHLLDARGATTTSIRAMIERISMQERHAVDLVVIDYLQLLADSKERGESTADYYARITRSLKLLARELRAPVLVLSQLSREPEHRGSREPQLSDLRSSGALEQDADVVLMLWRDEDGVTRAKIEKQRNGPTGLLPRLHFHGPTFRFYEDRSAA